MQNGALRRRFHYIVMLRLATEQVTTTRANKLSDQHDDGDQQIGRKDTYQPLWHFQRQELPLAH